MTTTAPHREHGQDRRGRGRRPARSDRGRHPPRHLAAKAAAAVLVARQADGAID
jgi:hypothetical protein